MIEEANQIRELVDGLQTASIKCFMRYPETEPTGSFAVLSITSCIPEAVDADGTEYITTIDYNLHLYIEGSRWDALEVVEELSALLSAYRIRRLGVSDAYSESQRRVHMVMALSETIDERGITYMER